MTRTILRRLDQMSDPGRTVNEDFAGDNQSCAWMLDGATGIVPNLVPDAGSDPAWLVAAFDAALRTTWHDNNSTEANLTAAAEATIARFREITEGRPVEPIDCPTACLLIARLCAERLEVSSIGDCWLIRASQGRITEFGRKLGDVAAPVHAELKRLQECGIAGAELNRRLLPFERAFRSRANEPGGYGILDLTTRWVSHMDRAAFVAETGDEFMLMTDGFYRLIDTFGAYTSETLFEAVVSKGLAALKDELRALENADPDGRKYHRTKKHDDATASFYRIDKVSD